MPRTDRELALILRKQGFDVPVPPRKVARNNEESRSQQALIAWWSVACKKFNIPEIMLFAVGNGGKRSPVTGAIMKREGVRAGTSDLLLLAKRGGFGGLCMEMKKEHGVVSAEQREFLRAAHVQGYAVTVAYSTGQACKAVEDYLNS